MDPVWEALPLPEPEQIAAAGGTVLGRVLQRVIAEAADPDGDPIANHDSYL